MHGTGFEPAKHDAVDLKSTPFDRSGTHAKIPYAGLEPATSGLEVPRSIQLS